jgi:3-hydroxybutyryl-CoA dehydratase
MSAQHGYYIEDVEPGMAASASKTVSKSDVAMFVVVSGDDNPVHTDAPYAATTQFKRQIAHGMLTASQVAGLRIGSSRNLRQI